MTTLRRQMQRKAGKDSMRTQIANLENLLRLRDSTIAYERAQRVAAQRGLVPYVRAISQLGLWAQEHSPDTVLKLRELGLWDRAGDKPLEVGYDPDEADPEIEAAIAVGEIPALVR